MRALIALALVGCASQPTLEAVNFNVNQTMLPKDDIADQWDSTCPVYGDCEDFALCKARKLLANGYAPDRMKLAVGYTAAGPHAVLLVDGLVLDNQTNELKQASSFVASYTCDMNGHGFRHDGAPYNLPKCQALKQLKESI